MKDIKLMKIGVLAGGNSSERKISLASGEAVYKSLLESGFKSVQFIDIKDDMEGVIESLDIDIAFIALHGGFGEDGSIQEILERKGISYTGSGPKSASLAMDKIISREILKKNNIPVPDYLTVDKTTSFIKAYNAFGMPFVVKPRKEGSSIGLSIVRRKSDVKNALRKAFKYSNTILLEKFIKGRELTVGILDKEPLPVVEIIPKEAVYDYEAKYNDDKTRYVVPAKLDKEIFEKAKELGKKSHSVIGCRDFSRVDMRLDENGDIFVLEVNTIPGLTEKSLLPKAAEAAGIKFDELCIKLLELANKNPLPPRP